MFGRPQQEDRLDSHYLIDPKRPKSDGAEPSQEGSSASARNDRNDEVVYAGSMNNPKSHPPKGAPAGTVWFGGPIPCFSVRIEITADDLKPNEITSLLGVAPTTTWEKGTTLLNRDGTVRRTTKSGRWSLSLQPAETDEWEANEALSLIIGRFGVDEAIWREIASSAEVRLGLALFLETANQGVSLDPASLRWLADRNIRLDFDIYAADESELELTAIERMPDQGTTH
jgi:hypothetical protein